MPAAAAARGGRRGQEGALLVLDWRKALCFVVRAQLVGTLGILGGNFL